MAISIKGINSGVIRQKNEFLALALKIKNPEIKSHCFPFSAWIKRPAYRAGM